MRALAVLMVISVLLPAPVQAGDVDNGHRLARRWCAPCHVVARQQRQSTGEAAPFSAIAAMPGFDQAQLAFYLLVPHPKMPDMALSRAEAADLAAYIATQK